MVKFVVQNKPYLPNQQCFQQKKNQQSSSTIIHIFNWPKSSTINLQKLTKKKQIRGNKIPNDSDDDEAQSELWRRRGREAEMSVSEWAAIWAELRQWESDWDFEIEQRWDDGDLGWARTAVEQGWNGSRI